MEAAIGTFVILVGTYDHLALQFYTWAFPSYLLLPYTFKLSLKKSFQRVKLYRLSDDGKWDDQGTGHVTVEYMEVKFILIRNLWN